MKIEKLHIQNFQGLAGKHEFDLSDKIVAFCHPNGAGKTSVLNALRYAMTGFEPDGEMITRGTATAAVQIDTASGKSYLKMKHAAKGKGAVYYVEKQKVTLKALNDFLQDEMNGAPIETARLASCGELLTSLNDQQFGELLLKYLPEEMTTDTVLERYPDANDAQKDIIRAALPTDTFGTEELDKFYATLVDRRKMLKAKIKELDAVVSSFGKHEEPDYTKEQVTDSLEKLTARRDAAVTFEALMKNYAKSLEEHEKHQKLIASVTEKIGDGKTAQHTDEERTALQTALTTAQEAATNAYGAAKELEASLEMMKKAKETISQPVCPLSEKIKCTTDKSPILDDLTKSISDSEKAYNKQMKAREDAQKKTKELEEQIKKLDTDNAEHKRIEELKKQKEELEKNAPKVPEKPEQKEDLKALEKEISTLREQLVFLQNIEKIRKYAATSADYKNILVNYEALVKAFSPKGPVKEAITEYYMDEFAAPCNEKAKELFPGMELKFVSDAGVSVLTDARGTGEFLAFKSLSGGEQACVAFLLLDLLSNLSGFRTIILDELSVLDNEAFCRLLDILIEKQDEYDTCIIACVNHDDTMAALKERGIKVTDINLPQRGAYTISD